MKKMKWTSCEKYSEQIANWSSTPYGNTSASASAGLCSSKMAASKTKGTKKGIIIYI